ncbi:zinc finger and BTB domain-containing protein 18.2-like isoform X5 [Biomphalaria glabrata]|uniref:Zinc finger and BTB domain-containing protein 18.2-like isoform X5 n=1 Tax=Biomphalaria glabrata TaxID=6526 RepID=A0A9U8E6F0_BIOGL|nr:zinc finger and BTB domain-containing protein 18.2-like isoform X5 [Biomphalaria glabrata]
MPEFQQLDVTVANRFISSLSKSLQALCHGCMDFDTGIEIVGYINVSIDCGRKVDYVLNERVLKSNTNSMTFVSNSFLAKKEQIKQTRDGSCSPVSEFTTSTPYPRPFRSSYQASHQSTSSFSQSYVLRGSQKRAMERDWRAPKRLRGERSQYSETVSSAQTASYSNLPGDSFKMPQSQNSSNATEDSQINIKQEVLENESERNESDNAEQTSDYKSNEPLSAADIKKDPDSCALPSEDTSQADDSTEPEAEFKGTFLQPSTSELTDETSVTDKQSTTAKLPETSELNKPSSSKCTDDVADDTHGESAHGESMAPASEMHLDYEEEEGNYPQSVYSDAGEGSSDTGQFEVIEIDDEDEDVQAMFAESRRKTFPSQGQLHCLQNKTVGNRRENGFERLQGNTYGSTQYSNLDFIKTSEKSIECSFCDCKLDTRVMYQKHMNDCHREKNALPFCCSICQKGFFSLTGLRHHIEAHNGRQFVCAICDARFQHKHNLKRHVLGVHKLKECQNCSTAFPAGPEFNSHLLICGSDRTMFKH